MNLKKGCVVNISSVHAIATSKNISAYAIAKSGMVGMTKSLALELAEYGVRVNAILPAAIDTLMLRSGLKRGHLSNMEDEDALVQELGVKHPLKRVGTALEISKTILFLADSNQSSFITGASIVVDGGTLAKLSTE